MRSHNRQEAIGRDPIEILMADGDRNEHLLMTMAADACRVPTTLRFVGDGDQLLRSLLRCLPSLPDLVLVDLNLPTIDAQSALIELGLHSRLRQLPVIVMTDTPTVESESVCYALGAFHVEAKPGRFGDMVSFLDRLIDPASELPIRPFDRGSLERPAHRRRFNDLADFD